jgi:beta-xylosidase
MTREPIITKIYTADPSAHVFEGKVYVYVSHDLDLDAVHDDTGDMFQMTDYHVFSLENALGPALDCTEILHLSQVPWADKQMWAPDAASKNGKYYLYFPARDREGQFKIGVATSDRPDGPFVAEPEPIEGSFSIDPCSFQDDDGSAYLYFGGLWGGQLQCWEKGFYDPNVPRSPAPEEDACCPKVAKLSGDMLSFETKPRDAVILDASGNKLKSGDIGRRYFEGPWMHKHDGRYYLSYSTGDAHTLVYATSDSPLGPFTFRGTILTPAIGWTTHHSIVEYKGKWYIYYHDSSLSGGASHKRSVKVQELFYEADGSIRLMNP